MVKENICKFCNNPINKKPENKKVKKKRVMDGFDELKKRGILE